MPIMKRLLLLPAAVILFGLGFVAHQPQTKVETHTVTKVKTVQLAAPIYHVGDTQDGITLVGSYPYSYQNTRGANDTTPPTVNLTFFAFSGVSEDDLLSHTVILTTAGIYQGAYGALYQIPACGQNACIPFIANSYKAIRYDNLEWQL